jgi:hypothetical protein
MARSWINIYGYRVVRTSLGLRQEHRLIMESMIGRPLIDNETVHHINGVRDDNRPENLELWSKSHPAGQRAEDKVSWARSIIALYGELFPEG